MLYFLLKLLFGLILDIFFRQLVIRNRKVHKGPVIYVVAPHHNQFLDPMVLITSVSRQIHFLAAQKSMDRPLIGFFGRAIGAIPVQRSLDIAFKGTGKISESNGVITGTNSTFLSQIRPKDLIVVNKAEFVVLRVVSDNECHVKGDQPVAQKSDFKVLPHVDQHVMFQTVIENLHKGLL